MWNISMHTNTKKTRIYDKEDESLIILENKQTYKSELKEIIII